MINFGQIAISEAWFGNLSLDSIWIGSIKVWPEGTPPVPPTPTGYTFSVIPTALTTDDSAKTVYFTVITDSPQWSVTPSQSWIIVNGITGGTLEVSIAANSGTTDRQGALAFNYRKSSTGGTGYETVYITQDEASVPNNIIRYVSTDDSAVTPYNTTDFGADIVSNTYYSDRGYGEIVFDGDVTQIGNNAFNQSRSLRSITIPNSVIWIEYKAFDYCTNLSSITIPDSVTTIGTRAFHECQSLSSITIPSGVTSIGDRTFLNCTSLSSISYNGTTSQWSSITKDSYWDYNIPATVVHCTDGDVPI